MGLYFIRQLRTLALAGLVCCAGTLAYAADINPFPRQRLAAEPLLRWTFQKGTAGWTAAHACSVTAADGLLKIKVTADDPYLFGPAIASPPQGPLMVRLRMRCQGGGGGEIFWATDQTPHFAAGHEVGFDLHHDGRWHDYEVAVPFNGLLQRLRLDPGNDPGTIEVEHITLLPLRYHPLEIEKAESTDRAIRLWPAQPRS